MDTIQKEIHEKQQFADFADICPDWAENIDAQNGFSNVDVDKKYNGRCIENANSCLVGEAHS